MPTRFIFLLGLVGTVSSQLVHQSECDLAEDSNCTRQVYEVELFKLAYRVTQPTPEALQNFSTLCDNTKSCLGKLTCTGASFLRDSVEKDCAVWQVASPDFLTCIDKFYTALYHSRLECAKGIDFLTRNLTERVEAYTSGKSCFLDFAAKECTNSTNHLLGSKFDKVLTVLTTSPRHGHCERLHNRLEGSHCKPAMLEMTEKSDSVDFEKVQPNDTNLLEVIKLCNESGSCLQNSLCKFNSAIVRQWKTDCLKFELANTEFQTCARKLRAEAPDLSQYSCLGDHDIFSQKPWAVCERFGDKTDCVKGVMKDYCGSGAVENFEQNVEMIKKLNRCKTN